MTLVPNQETVTVNVEKCNKCDGTVAHVNSALMPYDPNYILQGVTHEDVSYHWNCIMKYAGLPPIFVATEPPKIMAESMRAEPVPGSSNFKPF